MKRNLMIPGCLLLFILCLFSGFGGRRVQALAADVFLDLEKPVDSGTAYQTWGAPGLDITIYYSEDYIRENQAKFTNVSPEAVAGKDSDIYVRFVLKDPRNMVIRAAKNTAAYTEVACDLLLADRKTVAAHQTLSWKKGYYWEKDALTGVLPAGTYYLHFYQFREGACQVTGGVFTIFAPSKSLEKDDDASGPNDTKEQAVKLPAEEYVSGYLSYLGNDPADWYTFEVTGEEASLTVSQGTEWYYGGYDFTVYRDEGGQLTAVDPGEEKTIPLGKGKYYICFTFKSNEPADGYLRRGNSYDIVFHQKEDEPEKESDEQKTQDTGTQKQDTDKPSAQDTKTEAKKTSAAKGPKKGDTFRNSKLVYKITKVTASGGTVSVTGITNRKKTSVAIPAVISWKGKKYKVTAIGAGAFAKCAMKKVTIGSNVTSIGKRAFYRCKSLRTIIIQTKKLTAGKVGTQAFAGTFSKAAVKVPKSVRKKYKAFLVKKGIGKKAKFK